MTLIFKQGDLFSQKVDALVNTVNCVGVMGKGVALEFKRRWPKNYSAYRLACVSKKLVPGTLFIHQIENLFSADPPRYIINFPTKDHWRSKSKIEFIEAGLDSLVDQLGSLNIGSLAMPPLGCGNGGLDWPLVKSLIKDKLGNSNVDIIVMTPIGAEDKPEQDLEPVSMTLQRAALFKTLGELEDVFLGGFDRLSLQKIVYFLQELGIKYGLKFDRRFFGPYSYDLKKAYSAFERMGLISGFHSHDRISHVSPGGYAAADDFLDQTGQQERVEKLVRRLSHLIDGYESPYGLELLSSVHHLAKYCGINEPEIIHKLQDWNEEKRNKFSPVAISYAYLRLKEDLVL